MPHLLLYLLALTSLSTASTWAKLCEMPPEILGFWRLSLAAAVLYAFQKLFKNSEKIKIDKQTMKWVFLSGFFFFLHLWTYKYASKHTLISLTMILFATNPIWTALGNVIAFKEPITRRMIVSFVIAFIGIILLTKDQINTSAEHTVGNISALVSALLFAIYLISGKKARAQISNSHFAIVMYAVCGFFFLSASLISGAPFIEGYTGISWLSVAGLIIVPTLLGHFLFTYVMSSMNLAIMTCGKLIEPVIASFIAYFVFQEQLTTMTYVAFVLTSISIMNLFWPQIRRSFKSNLRKSTH